MCRLLVALSPARLLDGVAQEPESEPAPMPTDPGPDRRAHLVRDPGGHAAKPRDLLFTPDAKKLISVGEDRTIQVWDVATRQRLRVIRPPLGGDGQGGIPHNLVVDPKGQRIAFWVQVKNDKDRVLWTHSNGSFEKMTGDNWRETSADRHFPFVEKRRTPELVELFDASRNYTVTLYKDRSTIVRKDARPAPFANGTWDRRTTFICDLTTGQAYSRKHSGPLCFAADGKSLVIGEGHYLRLVEIATGRQMQTAKMKGNVSGFAFAPDGKTLAVVISDAQVYFLDANTFKLARTCTVPGTGHSLRNVAWADDRTLVSFTRQQDVVVLDAGTGELKHSYPRTMLLNQLPKGNIRHEGVQWAHGVPGTTRVFVRTKGTMGSWYDVSYLLDWATGAMSKGYVKKSTLGCQATAIAADLSIAAQGDSNLNDIIFWDPKTGQPFPEGKDVRRLRSAVRGANGSPQSLRWRPDGKGFAWLKLPDGKDSGHAELDLTTLTRRPLGNKEFKDYGRENARKVLGKAPGEEDPNLHLSERGLLRQWGPLSLKMAWPDLVVTGGPEPITRKASGPNSANYTFVTGGRIVSHPYHWVQLQVTEPDGSSQLTKVAQSDIGGLAVSPDSRYVLVGSADQTLTVFNPATSKVLLTVFPTGTDWIAWTPEGYYAASPGGEKLMGWHVDSAPDQLGTFHPAARFRKQFYRPDVIKLLLEKGSVKEALKAANGGLEGPRQEIDKMLPPQVSLRHKQDGALLTVEATAQAGSNNQPVTELHLLVDGRPALLDNRQVAVQLVAPGQQAGETWRLTLAPGLHRLSVRALSSQTYSISDEVSLAEVKPAQTAPRSTRRGTLYYVGIGVNQFQHHPELKLSGAVADVLDLEKCLQTRCASRFTAVRPTLLTDDKATCSAVLKTLTDLRDKLKPTDVAIVHYSSHGEVDPDGGLFLLSHDSKRGNLKETALPGQKLRDILGQYPCPVLLILDACKSGAFPLRSVHDPLSRVLADDSCGVAVMTAALAHQKALDTDKGGYLTRALIEGLSGQADPDKFSKRLYVPNLYTYVLGAVADKSSHQQTPLYLPSGSVPPIVLKDQ